MGAFGGLRGTHRVKKKKTFAKLYTDTHSVCSPDRKLNTGLKHSNRLLIRAGRQRGGDVLGGKMLLKF